MRVLLEFLKNTLFGGFFVLLPLLLFYLLFSELLDVVVGLATPIADLFPEGTFDVESKPVEIAIFLIVAASFLLGLTMRLGSARHFGNWLETNTIGRIPLYQAVKSLTERFAAMEGSGGFRPALLRGPEEQRDLAYLMEDLGDGFVTVMLPRAPTPMVGNIKVVPSDQVELLEVSLSDFTALISQWGVGSKALFDKCKTN